MNIQLEAIMGSGENTLKVGANPCRTANRKIGNNHKGLMRDFRR
jgi:hypothetical protein